MKTVFLMALVLFAGLCLSGCQEKNVLMEATTPIDSAIQSAVISGVNADMELREQQITVTVENGVVTLTGSVSSPEQSLKVETMAKNIDGVRSVDNRLTVNR